MPAPEIKLNNPFLPAIVLLLIVLQLAVPFQGWMILLVALGGAWFVAFLWARALARNLHLVREIRFGWAQVGDRLEERFTLINRSILPGVWVDVRDHSTLPDHSASRATGIDGQTENRWSIKSICTRRGVFTLGPTSLGTGDPFGIYSVTLNQPARTSMVVLPPIVPLPNIEVAPGGRVGEGHRRAHALERTINTSTVRDYHPGDAFASIHWRTTARHDELFVRQFESTPSSNWWIVLDLDERVQVGQGEHSTIEHAIILAASLAVRGLRLRCAVGLMAFPASGLIWLPPRESEAQRWEILRALAHAAVGTRPLGELLTQIKPALKGVTSLVIVTPNVHGDWIPSLLPLRWRGIVPTILLLDPISFGGPMVAGGALPTLADLDIAHYLITRDVLDRPEMRPGQRGHWDWRISPQGRAIPKQLMRETAWHVID